MTIKEALIILLILVVGVGGLISFSILFPTCEERPVKSAVRSKRPSSGISPSGIVGVL